MRKYKSSACAFFSEGHGYSFSDGIARNDRLLPAFKQYPDEKFGELKE